MGSLTELLLATQDPARRAQAEHQIQQAEQQNVEEYFKALAQELAGAERPIFARQLSGLLLKNGLAAKDAARDRQLKERWSQVSVAGRDLVKQATTSALVAAQVDVGKAAAQVLAKIGSIEVPTRQWPELVPLLLQHVTNGDPRARQISLITLGFLCEELTVLQLEGVTIETSISDSILTAVVQGMRDSDMQTKLEATRAFYNAVVLAKENFQRERERNFIMDQLCELCRCQSAELVQIAAFECLVQIATDYYDFLMPYMSALGPLTLDTIQNASEKVAIPAMEFWSTVCDEELWLKEEPGERQSLNLIHRALPLLVPLLTQTLTRRVSEEDDDTWNLAMAAGTCLGLVAQVVGDACVEHVLHFVQQNFGNQDWRYREASFLSYGSIMEGPTSEKMRPFVESSYGFLVQALSDQSVAVRDTIAWTLGRIAQFHPTIVPVKQLTPILVHSLQDVPRVASNICWLVQVLAEGQPQTGSLTSAPSTTPLSEFFMVLAEGLLRVTGRPDADERNLRMSAYNALSVLVQHTGNDCLVHMQGLAQEMVTHLANSFKTLDRECELQGYICGVLTALTQRLREGILPLAGPIMEQCLKVFQAYQQVKGTPVIQEEALLLATALACSVGPNFESFMSHYIPYFRIGLQNFEDVQVCYMATGAVGDLCRALEGKITTYFDDILHILYTNLQNPVVDRKIKAAIITCFGDIALAVTGEFEKYLPPVVQMLQEASRTTLQDGPAGNEEWIEYLNSLREGVLEAYTGIIHGLREANKLHLFKEHVTAVIMFVSSITEDKSANDSVMNAAVGVIGDLIFVFQHELTNFLAGAAFVTKLIEYASMRPDPKMQKTAQWLRDLLQRFSAGRN